MTLDTGVTIPLDQDSFIVTPTAWQPYHAVEQPN